MAWHCRLTVELVENRVQLTGRRLVGFCFLRFWEEAYLHTVDRQMSVGSGVWPDTHLGHLTAPSRRKLKSPLRGRFWRCWGQQEERNRLNGLFWVPSLTVCVNFGKMEIVCEDGKWIELAVLLYKRRWTVVFCCRRVS